MTLSVIICTHNPRMEYLRRALGGLRDQSLALSQWELLLIDNASKEAVSEHFDLVWHPNARHVREENLGLTQARLRGIKEAVGELLVFVDDDNVLGTSYLAGAKEIAGCHPWIGAFGGNILPVFEKPPEPWAAPVLPELAIRKIEHPSWAMAPGIGAWLFAPLGAGLIIRSVVARDYLLRCTNDPIRQGLDRKGGSLISCGDIDMALCACLNSFGVGLFPELVLEHLIPAFRLEREYLLRLTEGVAESHVLLAYLHGEAPPPVPIPPCRSERLLEWWRNLRKSEPTAEQKFLDEVLAARGRGREKGASKARRLASLGTLES